MDWKLIVGILVLIMFLLFLLSKQKKNDNIQTYNYKGALLSGKKRQIPEEKVPKIGI